MNLAKEKIVSITGTGIQWLNIFLVPISIDKMVAIVVVSSSIVALLIDVG